MIKRTIDGMIAFICDECGEELETDTSNFQHAMQTLRASKWRNVKNENGWEHYCPDCEQV